MEGSRGNPTRSRTDTRPGPEEKILKILFWGLCHLGHLRLKIQEEVGCEALPFFFESFGSLALYTDMATTDYFMTYPLRYHLARAQHRIFVPGFGPDQKSKQRDVLQYILFVRMLLKRIPVLIRTPILKFILILNAP